MWRFWIACGWVIFAHFAGHSFSRLHFIPEGRRKSETPLGSHDPRTAVQLRTALKRLKEIMEGKSQVWICSVCIYKVSEHFPSVCFSPENVYMLDKTASVVHGMDSTGCWRHSFKILAHFATITSCNSCRFFRCLVAMYLLFYHSPKVFRSGDQWGDQ